jgi:predicted RNA-binding protein with TRAM domain
MPGRVEFETSPAPHLPLAELVSNPTPPGKSHANERHRFPYVPTANLPDLLNESKLSHAGPETANREAELTAPTDVGSGALLGHVPYRLGYDGDGISRRDGYGVYVARWHVGELTMVQSRLP